MAVFLTDLHREHLSFLHDHSPEVLVTFARAAMDYISKGPNLKTYTSVSQKFGVNAETIQDAIESLVHILVECCKFDVAENEFSDLILAAGFDENQAHALVSLYTDNKNVINEIFEKSDNLLYFYDLQWRFESKEGSRALLNQTSPLITMNLKLADSSRAITADKKMNCLLQTDPSTLVHITETLEKALQISQSHNIRKIEKQIKKLALQK